jgi:hypothetical protein
MKKTILALSLAAAFTLPAHAHEISADDGARAFDFKFDFDPGGIGLGDFLAQADGIHIETQLHGQDMEQRAHDFFEEMQSSMAYMFTDRAGRGRVVKGQPYSADVVTENNQALSDGNVITHRNVNKVWRDGEGRTRQENYRAEKLRSIYISDPVGAMSYTLIPGSKIAVAVPRAETHVHPARVRIERPERGDRPKTSTSTTTETTSDGRRVTTIRTVDAEGAPGVREEVRVQVYRVGDDANISVAPVPPVPPIAPGAAMATVPPVPPIPPIPPIPGLNTMHFESTANLGKGETKSLGAKDFDGVKAEGKQTTWTIPAGKIGNRNPIVVISETWYSPELQVTVYSRHNDPRTGESIYRLASLKRAEPASDLFKVPADYTTKGRGRDKAAEKDKAKEKDK